MEGREMPRMHKYGESTNSNYDDNHMSHHFWSGMYEISVLLDRVYNWKYMS